MIQDVKTHLDIDTGVFHVTVIAPVTVYHHQSHNKADLIIGDTNNTLNVSAGASSRDTWRSRLHARNLVSAGTMMQKNNVAHSS